MVDKAELLEVEIIEEEVKAPALRNFTVPLADINDLLGEYSEIPDIDPESDESEEQYKYVKQGHIAFSKARNAIEKRRKEIGAPAFEFHKAVIAAAKDVQDKINPTENLLKAQRDKVEKHKENKRIEMELAEESRKDAHRKNIAAIVNLPLQHFNSNSELLKEIIETFPVPNDKTFEEFIDDALAAYTTMMQQIQSAYETKVKAENAERIEREAQDKRDSENAERKEKERIEREKFEAERAEFQRQKDEQDAQIRAQQEEIDRQNAERKAEDLAKQQKEKREKREALEESNRIAKIVYENEERIKREKREAEERVAKEKRDKEAREEREKAEASAKKKKDAEDKKLFDERKAESIRDLFEAVKEFDHPMDELIDIIIDGKIRHVKWSPKDNGY